MRFSWVILVEDRDGSMLAHTEWHEGNLLVRTQIRSLRMLGLLNGSPGGPTAGHPLCHFVPCSSCSKRLWLDLVGFAFEPRSLVGPTAIIGPISDTDVLSRDV
jgi:hypothetical protein